ncbi:MAG: CapA family protein [Bacteroidales bacterium]|jgi:poly-gamma-glutamate synthesis protein (capsule biosynthesis protein)
MKLKNYFYKIFCIALLAFLITLSNKSYFVSGENSKLRIIQDTTVVNVCLMFAGDVMQHMPQICSAYDSVEKTYNYYKCFQFIKPLLERSDVAIANFESTLGNKPYSGYPQFSCPDDLAKALNDVGFKILLTANNHCLDKSQNGLQRTIKVMDSLKIAHLGTYIDSTSRCQNYPFVLNVKGIKIALLNCTSTTNKLTAVSPNIVNYTDTSEIKKDIYKIKQSKPDFMIMFVHWGNEYEQTPSNEQKKFAEFCFSNGIGLIIGSHPHVLQPINEIKVNYQNKQKNCVVYYSLGNFVSNQRERYKNGGIIAEVNIKKDLKKDSAYISTYGYYPTYVHKEMSSSKTNFYILPVKNIQKDTINIKFSPSDKKQLETFIEDTRELLGLQLELK